MSYKDDIQAIYMELALDLYGKDYWELTDEQQMELYQSAQERYIDRMADRADMLRDIEKERPR